MTKAIIFAVGLTVFLGALMFIVTWAMGIPSPLLLFMYGTLALILTGATSGTVLYAKLLRGRGLLPTGLQGLGTVIVGLLLLLDATPRMTPATAATGPLPVLTLAIGLGFLLLAAGLAVAIQCLLNYGMKSAPSARHSEF